MSIKLSIKKGEDLSMDESEFLHLKRKYAPLQNKFLNKFCEKFYLNTLDMDRDDVFQLMDVLLVKAYKYFDESRGNSFITYLYFYYKTLFRSLAIEVTKKMDRKKKEPQVSIDQYPETKNFLCIQDKTIEDNEWAELVDSIWEELYQPNGPLTRRDRVIFDLRELNYTQWEICNELYNMGYKTMTHGMVSGQTVSNRTQKIYDCLKKGYLRYIAEM